MIYALAIGVSVGFVVISAFVDAEHILKEEYIDNHGSRWLLRLMFFMAMGLFHWKYFFASALLFAGLFDQVLNILRDKPLLYLGTVAYWDKFFSKRKWLYIIVKLLCLLSSIFLYLSVL